MGEAHLRQKSASLELAPGHDINTCSDGVTNAAGCVGLRLERDLHKTNLCSELGMDLTSEQIRVRKHKPLTVVLAVLAIVAPLALFLPDVIRKIVTAAAANQVGSGTFAQMPEGWTVDSHVVIPARQLEVFSKKLGGSVVHASNTVIRAGDRSVQINQLSCQTAKDAAAVHQTLLGMKQNSRHVCRNGNEVYEFVCRTPEAARFAIEARYRLPIQPAEAKYQIRFDAAPITGGDSMAWNKLFNLFLVWQTGNDRDAVESRITELSKGFHFSDELILKNTGLGPAETQWSIAPEPSEKSAAAFGDATLYKLQKLPTRAGVPVARVQGIVTSTTFGTTSLADPDSREALLRANQFWPADSPAMAKLSSQITSGAKTDQQKVDALLAWFADEQNIRFAGETGSRYGVLKVLQQKHGHCWDFSDLFVTLCRASGIPARQVLGWLHLGEGHVWAEVLIDDRWRQFDPTTGVGCGSDYLPLVISIDGKMPMVYASPVRVELQSTK